MINSMFRDMKNNDVHRVYNNHEREAEVNLIKLILNQCHLRATSHEAINEERLKDVE